MIIDQEPQKKIDIIDENVTEHLMTDGVDTNVTSENNDEDNNDIITSDIEQ